MRRSASQLSIVMMKWSWKLGRFFGILVQVHWTFVILIAWIVFEYATLGADTLEVIQGVGLVLAVFGCVVLHEFGHALTARRFGINTKDITLLPIGGVARLERMPEDPRQEFLVAIAGPAVNVVIAAILAGGLSAAGALRPVSDVAMVGGNLFAQLMWVNVVLVFFNLLPAFPMDGGRVLRALLAMRMGYLKATQIAAGVGQVMAILFGFAGLMGNYILLFIALFVFLGAQAEAQHVQVRFALDGVTVADAMMTRFHTLDVRDSIQRAIDELLAGAQQDFPVMRDGTLAGMLLRRDLVNALRERGGATPVAAIVRTECPVARVDDDLHLALSAMRQGQCSSIPVVDGSRLVGLLTLENVGELMMVTTATEGAAPKRGLWGRLFAID